MPAGGRVHGRRGRELTLDAVRCWALGEGLSSGALDALHDDVLGLAVARLMQAIYRERFGGPSRLDQWNGGRSAGIVLGEGPTLRLAVTAFPFGRLEPAGRAELVRGPHRHVVRTGGEFLDALKAVWTGVRDVPFDRLAADFQNSLANLVLNRALVALRPTAQAAPEPAFEGHNSHPFPGLRLGPSLAQIVECSHLSGGPAELRLARAREHRFESVEHADGVDFFERWAGRPGEPGTIPLHPWQVVLSPVVESCRRFRMLDLLGDGVPATPLASQRTCRIAATGWDVKLAVDATLTSERRLLYPINALNAPAVSALAHSLVETYGPDTLAIQRDAAATAYRDTTIGSHVAAIVRPPVPHLGGDAVVSALLLWTGPRLARSVLPVDDRGAARELLLEYSRVLLRGPIELYARDGLALEPHLQNTLIRVRAGRPVGLVVRDLDATILDSERVPALMRERGLRFAVDPWHSMPPFATGGDRLVNALLHSHLSQAIVSLVETTGVDADDLSTCAEAVWGELIDAHSGATRNRIVDLKRRAGAVKCLLRGRAERSTKLAFAPARNGDRS